MQAGPISYAHSHIPDFHWSGIRGASRMGRQDHLKTGKAGKPALERSAQNHSGSMSGRQTWRVDVEAV